jgi:glycosyltransferase involved in cell wall biosynthesis
MLSVLLCQGGSQFRFARLFLFMRMLSDLQPSSQRSIRVVIYDNRNHDEISFWSDTMKVLITSPSLDETENVSGISTMVSNIIAQGGGAFVHFPAGRKDGEASGPKWLLSQLELRSRLRKAIADVRPDVLHINTAFEPRAMIRDLVLAKTAKHLPVVLHVHGGRYVLQETPKGFISTIATKLLSSASRVIALSDAEAEALTKLSPGVRVKVVANAVDTEKFPEVERKWGDKNIIYLGRLHQPKGLDDIVEVCRILLEQGFRFRFSCYGTGPDKDKFTAAMTGVLGDQFHYGGVISGTAKIQALNEADIFLMPSRYEGLPLALLEAMASGCVPVVSARGSMTTVVKDGQNGFLVEPGDLMQIVGKLKNLLSEGEPGWLEFRRNARETVRTRFDMSGYVSKLNEVYSKVVLKR